ncbi:MULTISPECIES: YqjF family protein [unclassified Paenibacillus]|uniref:YqjF family protein n=1 Tax=unclassified Paenibacillus TaxID=185978 RepID=UPI00363A3531
MMQSWLDLLFAHWPVHYDHLRELVPPGLKLDTFDGDAWISIVPFRMNSIRLRGLPPIPYTSAFAELNVRTYVTVGDKPGVYFFSLDAANRLAVMAARRFFYLPYFNASMKLEERKGVYNYVSHRTDKRGASVSYEGIYSPVSPAFYSKPQTFEHWLTERYCLYSVDKKNHIWRGEIHHLPWTLHAAEAEFKINTMASGQGIRVLDTKPLLHFSKQLDVLIWPISRAGSE